MSVIQAGIDINNRSYWALWDTTATVIQYLPLLSIIIILAGILAMILNKRSKNKKYPGSSIFIIGIFLLLFAVLANFTLMVI